MESVAALEIKASMYLNDVVFIRPNGRRRPNPSGWWRQNFGKPVTVGRRHTRLRSYISSLCYIVIYILSPSKPRNSSPLQPGIVIMARIEDLPIELIRLVNEYLLAGNLAAFARTGHRFYSITTPALYKYARFHIDSSSPWHPLRWAAENGRVDTLRQCIDAGMDVNMELDDDIDKSTRDLHSFQIRIEAIEGKKIWDSHPKSTSNEDWGPLRDDDDDESMPIEHVPIKGYRQNGFERRLRSISPTTSNTTESEFSEHPLYYGLYDEDLESWPGTELPLGNHNGASINEANTIRRALRALHLAAAGGHSEAVQILLDHGAEINASCKNMCPCQAERPRVAGDQEPNARHHVNMPEYSALHLAICHFQKTTAKLLLRRGASIRSSEPTRATATTALHTAAATGQSDLCRYLLDEGYVDDVDILDRSENGLSPFYWAYFNGHWNTTVQFLLERGANIDFLVPGTPLPNGQPLTSILYEACAVGRYDDAIKLLHLGADVNKGDYLNNVLVQTPLHATCRPSWKFYYEPPRSAPLKLSGRADEDEDIRRKLIELMIQKGADTDAKSNDPQGQSALHFAAEYHIGCALEILLAAGADLQSRNSKGRTPLMEACLSSGQDYRFILNGSVPQEGFHSIKLLLDNGPSLHATDDSGNTVLHIICQASQQCDDMQKQENLVRLLLDRGVKESARTDMGQTALQIAFEKGSLRICDILIRHRKTIEPLKREEIYSMMDGSISNRPSNLEAFNLLYDLDVDNHLSSTSKYVMNMIESERTALADAYLERNTPCLNAAEKATILQAAIKKSHARLTRRMLSMKAPVNRLDQDGHTPLYSALSWIPPQDLDRVVEELLAAGADVHYKHSSSTHMTPLQKAIANRKQSVVEIMLRNRPLRDDPQAPKGVYLHTAACSMPSKRIFLALLRAGAEVTELDANGDTPLSVFLRSVAEQPQWMTYTGGVENTICLTIRYLWSRDVNISRRNKSDDKSILHYLSALTLYQGEDPGRTRVARELQRRIKVVPVRDGPMMGRRNRNRNGGVGGDKTLQFMPGFRRQIGRPAGNAGEEEEEEEDNDNEDEEEEEENNYNYNNNNNNNNNNGGGSAVGLSRRRHAQGYSQVQHLMTF